MKVLPSRYSSRLVLDIYAGLLRIISQFARSALQERAKDGGGFSRSCVARMLVDLQLHAPAATVVW